MQGAARREARANAAVRRVERARQAADAARQRYLTALARRGEGAWARLEKLVESSRYDEADTLAVDLRDLARRDGTSDFEDRFEALRKRQTRRRGFFYRWRRTDAAGGA